MTAPDSILLVLAVLILLLDIIRTARARRRPTAEQVDVVAQAIAHCYGHGPLAVMDQTYQDEFRRDARAALAAMRRRK